MDADHVERVVVAELVLQADREGAEHTGDERRGRSRRAASTERTGRGDGDQAGDDAGGRAERGARARRGSSPSAASRAPRQRWRPGCSPRRTAAMPLAATAEPALKPNQPNHSRPAPSMTSGRLCGRIGSFAEAAPLAEHQGQREAGRTGVDVHRGAAGEVDRHRAGWRSSRRATASPAVGAVEGEDPVRDREVDERWPRRRRRRIQAPNLARSAIAPEISATVMIAKTAWKPTKASAGTVTRSAPSEGVVSGRSDQALPGRRTRTGRRSARRRGRRRRRSSSRRAPRGR